MKPFASITVDLDGIDCYRSIHGLPTSDGERAAGRPDSAYTVGVRRMLGFFETLKLQSTLFVIGRDIEAHQAHRDLLTEAHTAGHELASHSFFHDYALREKTPVLLEEDLRLGEEAIEWVTGAAPTGFRTPGYNLDDRVLDAVEKRGYRYDSSVFPCPAYWAAKAGVMAWLNARGRPSRSAMTRPVTLLAPIDAYRPGRPFWKRGDRDLIEVPMTLVPGVRFPVIGTSLHILGQTGFDRVYPALRRVYTSVLNLEFHAIDFMDSHDEDVADLVGHQPDLRVDWSVKAVRYRHVIERLRQDYELVTLDHAVENLRDV